MGRRKYKLLELYDAWLRGGVLDPGHYGPGPIMMMFTPERHLPPHIRTARASPQRHTAAGTAAPTTADTGNTVPQRANPTQTAYVHPRRRAQAQGQRLGTWTLVRPQKKPMRV